MLGILEKGVVADEEKVYKINGGLNSCETMVFGFTSLDTPSTK
jgi:hypothetical protein